MAWKIGDGPLRLPPPPAESFSTTDRELRADVVIVGAGPGGSAAARELSRVGMSVVILEEGPAESRFRPNQGNAMRYHMQEGGGMVAMGSGGAFMPIAAGRGLGGGTLVNSAISWRAPDHILQEWAELLKTEQWSPAAMKPYYDEVWELLGVCQPQSDEVAGANNRLIVRGAKALGYEGGYLDRYTPQCRGCGICYFGCPSGGKSSTNLHMLPEAVQNGTRIQADCKVREFLLEGDRVVGVRGQLHHPDTREPGGKVTVYADKVIVACGGIGTPRLLHHAGIAKKLGPAVGKGLHVHPGNLVAGICEERVELWHGATQGAWFKIPELPGVLPHTFSAPPEVCLLLQGAVGQDVKKGMQELPHLCGAVVMVSDKGEGTVSAWDDGRAYITYEFAPDDLERTKKGMYHTARVLLAGGAKEVFAPVHGTGRYTDADSLFSAIKDKSLRDFQLYAAHPMSTCRMGLDPQTSVVRPDGRSHQLEGLYLMDGSIFPTSLGVNPSITIFAMVTAMARRMAGGTL